MRLFFSILLLALAGCNPAEDAAVGACEVFVKERLRSPSTFNRISSDFSGVSFKSEGRDVKMVTIEYDAANAFGTPVRGSQQCVFEVDKNGNYSEDPDHAARMSAIGADLEIAPCCLLEENEKISGKTTDEIVKEADEAADAAEAAAQGAEDAANDAARAANELSNR